LKKERINNQNKIIKIKNLKMIWVERKQKNKVSCPKLFRTFIKPEVLRKKIIGPLALKKII
jgi:hypothetical protein